MYCHEQQQNAAKQTEEVLSHLYSKLLCQFEFLQLFSSTTIKLEAHFFGLLKIAIRNVFCRRYYILRPYPNLKITAISSYRIRNWNSDFRLCSSSNIYFKFAIEFKDNLKVTIQITNHFKTVYQSSFTLCTTLCNGEGSDKC